MRQDDLSISLQLRQKGRCVLLCRICAQMDQVRKLRSGHVEGSVWKCFLGLGNDSVVGEYRMRDDSYIPLRHVAACAIIGRRLVLPQRERQSTAFLGVAGKAFLSKVFRRVSGRRLHVRIVATDATQSSTASQITLAESHGQVMLQHVIFGSRVTPKRNQENAERSVKFSAGQKIALRPSCPPPAPTRRYR